MGKKFCSANAEILRKAERLWEAKVEEFAMTHSEREYGSCVLGAGLDIEGGGRIDAPWRYQGSLTWEHSVDEIIKFLADHGIKAWYNPGRMD